MVEMEIKKDCKKSKDGKYRFWLQRLWNKNKPTCVFVMLNPSIADCEKDDATIRKCIRYGDKWGFGNLEVVNLFAFISTKRERIKKLKDKAIGESNDDWIIKTSKKAKLVVVAWGNDGEIENRGNEVLSLLKKSGIQPKALKINKTKQPKHPLYHKKDFELKSLSKI